MEGSRWSSREVARECNLRKQTEARRNYHTTMTTALVLRDQWLAHSAVCRPEQVAIFLRNEREMGSGEFGRC